MSARFKSRWMSKGAGLVLLLAAGPVWSGVTQAADTAAVQQTAPVVLEASCRICHEGRYSARRAQRCERSAARVLFDPSTHAGPDVILLDMLKGQNPQEDWYGPVPFNHAAHTGMAGSCTVCHHYTPEGQAHPECRSCHEQQLEREDVRKPSLKGAYHRQCMGCHREWAHEDSCHTCHLPKGDTSDRLSATSPPVYMAEKHPVVESPEIEVYQTELEPGLKSRVVFHHKDHVQKYGNTCVDCHQRDNCTRCHEDIPRSVAATAPFLAATAPGPRSEEPLARSLPASEAEGAYASQRRDDHSARRAHTPEQRHRACAACHLVESKSACGQCHQQEGQPKPEPFDHAWTGWPLMPYHQGLRCRECHQRVPFSTLDASCGSCHAVPLLAADSPDRHVNCIGCHDPHKPWYEYMKKDAAADLCLICHRDSAADSHLAALTTVTSEGRRPDVGSLNVATTRPFDMSGHPVGSPGYRLPENLVQAGARLKAGDSSLQCLACHSAATTKFEPIAFAESGPDGLCLACHPEQRTVFGSLHDIRSDPQSPGTCRTCHPVHGPQREAVRTEGDPDGRCTACHQARGWGQAKSAGSVPHPKTACTECHNPHESRFGRFLMKPVTELCVGCHTEEGRMAGGPHDATRHPDAWPDPAAARRGVCLACHIPHGNQADGLLRMAPAQTDASPDAACLACHKEAGWDAGGEISVLHPREIRPDQKKVDPSHVPSDAAGHARMTCNTCHDAHGGAEPGYLTRGSPGEPAGLCLSCHEQKKFIRHTGHSTESFVKLGFDAAACRPCHAMHARRDRAFGQMLSPRFLKELEGGKANVPGDGALCLACHHANGPAPMPAVAAHPTVAIHNTVAPDAPGYLPLFDDSGHVSADGHITCRTCHLSHGRLDLLQLAENNDTMSEQDRRVMRVNVRSFVAPNICTQCHGQEGRLRFLIFHDASQRGKLPPVVTQPR